MSITEGTLNEMGKIRHTVIQAYADRSYTSLDERFNQTYNMRHVRAEKFLKIPGTHTRYDYLKFYAIERIEVTFAQQLHLMYKMSECTSRHALSELSRNVFSWEPKHYLERRAEADQTFVKVLNKIPETCLEFYKFKIDLIQLLNYATLIFDGIYSRMGHLNISVIEHIEKPLNEARTLIIRNAFMEDEYKKNVSNYTLLINSRWLTALRDEALHQKRTKANLQSKLLHRHILDPIQLRYTINWYTTKLEEKEEKMRIVENNLNNGIENYTTLMKREIISTNSCTGFLYEYIDYLKNEITKMQAKYDTDLENIDSELTSKHLQIDKLRDSYQFLRDEIKRFHEEIEQINSGIPRKYNTTAPMRRDSAEYIGMGKIV